MPALGYWYTLIFFKNPVLALIYHTLIYHNACRVKNLEWMLGSVSHHFGAKTGPKASGVFFSVADYRSSLGGIFANRKSKLWEMASLHQTKELITLLIAI